MSLPGVSGTPVFVQKKIIDRTKMFDLFRIFFPLEVRPFLQSAIFVIFVQIRYITIKKKRFCSDLGPKNKRFRFFFAKIVGIVLPLLSVQKLHFQVFSEYSKQKEKKRKVYKMNLSLSCLVT